MRRARHHCRIAPRVRSASADRCRPCTSRPPAAIQAGCWLRRSIWLFSILMAPGCSARAPVHTFVELQHRVPRGATVYVIDSSGRETRGTVDEVLPSALVLTVGGDRRRMDSDTVRQVQRYGDSLWNGLLIGMAVATPGMLIADPTYDPCPADPRAVCPNSQVGQRILAVGIMGGIGAAIDALIRGRHQIYVAPDQQARHAPDGRRRGPDSAIAARVEGVLLGQPSTP